MKKVLILPFILFVVSGCSSPEDILIRKADRIHSTILTVDTHCDTPMSFSDPDFDIGKRNAEGCIDFPRMIEGGLHSEFFAVFIGQGPRNDSTYNKVHEEALKTFNAVHENVNRYPDVVKLALTADDAYRIRKDGKIAAYIGLENGYPVGKDISRVRQYYDLGARYITLSHSANNDICDSSSDPNGPEQNGLSEFGGQVVREMNRLGMMVDVSHISDEAFYDVLKVTSAPVIASHSSCRALCGSHRNMTDDMLLALRDNGGVIQICILSNYLRTPEPNPTMTEKLAEIRQKFGDYNKLPEDSKKLMRVQYREIRRKYEKLATVKDIVDHIDHVVQVIGIDYVGIGTDFDGGGGVEGCRSVDEMKNITIELLRRGYTKPEIEKIWGGNFMRVFRKVEELAAV